MMTGTGCFSEGAVQARRPLLSSASFSQDISPTTVCLCLPVVSIRSARRPSTVRSTYSPQHLWKPCFFRRRTNSPNLMQDDLRDPVVDSKHFKWNLSSKLLRQKHINSPDIMPNSHRRLRRDETVLSRRIVFRALAYWRGLCCRALQIKIDIHLLTQCALFGEVVSGLSWQN